MDSQGSHICGIIGGMSYHSSSKYPITIHDAVNAALGDYNCAELMTYDVNFQNIREKMTSKSWEEIGKKMADIAEWMVAGGAERVAIATNTVHKEAERVMRRIGEEYFLHIGDCITAYCHNQQVQRVLLLGTKETTSGDFIKKRLENGGLEIIIPDSIMQEELDKIIFKELCHDLVRPGAIKWFQAMLGKMLHDYAIDGVILGCTELVMLSAQLKEQDLFQLQLCNRCRQPVVFIDSAEAQIAALIQVCLGKWHPLSPD